MTRTTSRSSRAAARALFVLGVAAVALTGCRSDGGVGRRDAQRSLTTTLDLIEAQYERDVRATQANGEMFSNWWDRQMSAPWRDVNRAVNLYLEGDALR